MSLKIIESGIKDVQFGQNVTIVSPVNIYGCTVGYDTFIGNDCFIGHGVMFINDLFMKGGAAQGDQTLWSSTNVGNNVSIGSNATILPVTICNNVVICAG